MENYSHVLRDHDFSEKSLKGSERPPLNWLLKNFIGFVLIGVGIFSFFISFEFIENVSLFGLSLTLIGLFEILYFSSNKSALPNHWRWAMAISMIVFLIGTLIMDKSSVIEITLRIYIGFALLLLTILNLLFLIDLIPNKQAYLILAIVSMMFSLILIWNPTQAVKYIDTFTGLAFITLGIFYLYASVVLKRQLRLWSKIFSVFKD